MEFDGDDTAGTPEHNLAVRSAYEVTLTVGSVKEEHAAWVTRAVITLTDFLKLDGTDLAFDISVERNRDGVERLHEIMNPEDYGG